MAKLNFLTLLVLGYLFSGAQATTVSDSVNTGPNNAYRVFYNLATGEKTAVSDTDWHLAFSVRPTPIPPSGNPFDGVSIRINGHQGVTVWVAENNDTSTFLNLDTTGMANWRQVIDSDDNLSYGALNNNYNITNPYDFGWGMYDINTHDLIGDSIYLIQLPDGSYKKVWIKDMNYDTAYDVEFANLDNSALTHLHFLKGNYPGKEFVYLNLENDSIIDKEPAASSWDLLFLKYIALNVPGVATYPVAGVWVNPQITAARDSGANVTSADSDSYTGLTFTNRLNTIGWNWVNYTGTYSVVPSLDYFIKGNDGKYYKLTFVNPGYGTDATGVFYFEKLQLANTAVTDLTDQDIISTFPNPASETLNITLSQPAQEIQIADMTGKIITDLMVTNKVIPVDISALSSGIYVLSVKSEASISTSKFVVTH